MDNGALEAGTRVRREVLGAEYVDAAIDSATDFSRPLQNLITEYCWGGVWARPGLPRKTRSIINLAMLTALGKTEELMTHVRGAINNGCTVEEIQETLLQATVYCGVPAGVNAFRAAQEVLQEAGLSADGRGQP